MKTSLLLLSVCSVFSFAARPAMAQNLPILFVTQVPPPGVTGTVTSIGGNHLPTVEAAPRGGDLMIRYPDSTVRNLTREAGFGAAGSDQGVGSIAVRDPHVHWSGQKAVFSMVVSTVAPATDRWQMYEVSGLEQGGSVRITQVQEQPANFNNVQPCYAPDDRLIFVSDRTRDGSLTTYPALDEKGTGRINTGLWSLNPDTGDLFHLEHSPSGSFDPIVDHYGRVLFTRWDHLQRDERVTGGNPAGGFDFASETSTAPGTAGVFTESYPEALVPSGSELGLRFDLFMPWTVNPDGTDLLTLNHIGRHEISPGFTRSRTDANLTDFVPPSVSPSVKTRAAALMQLTEHSVHPGKYFGVDAVLNGMSAGRVVALEGGVPGANPLSMRLMLFLGSGFARDPVVLANGSLLASVANGPSTATSSYGGNPGTNIDPNQTLPVTNPLLIRPSSVPATGGFPTAVFLSPFIALGDRTATNHVSAGTLISFAGPLWQLQPVEVRPVSRPVATTSSLESAETEIFHQAGVSPNALRAWLRQNDLALLTVRNVTTRDSADRQQPTNLAVPGGTQTLAPDGGPAYQVKSLQFLQGEYLRGYGLTFPGDTAPDTGRRIKALSMRAIPGVSQTAAGSPEGSVAIAADGSATAIVPARRALSWQLLQPDGASVVRERYWLSFQAGEVRACTSCHGVNSSDQAGHSVATNPPAALRSMLETLKQTQPALAETNTFRIWSEARHGVSLRADADDDGDGTSNIVEWAQGSNPVVRPAQSTVPLKVELLPSGGDLLPRVSFSRSLTETRAQVVLEGSPNMQDWRTVANFGSSTAIGQDYVKSSTPQSGGTTEMVTLTSLVPVSESVDRYYRLRVSAN